MGVSYHRFPLSNCANSGGFYCWGVAQFILLSWTLTWNGNPWDLDRVDGGLTILPPYTAGKTGEWYKGTANAIYQILSISGSMIQVRNLILGTTFKMNYNKMADSIKRKKQTWRFAHINVPLEESFRYFKYGWWFTHRKFWKNLNIRFQQASMGIYIFIWKVLKII